MFGKRRKKEDDGQSELVALISLRGVITGVASGGFGQPVGISFLSVRHLVELAFGLPNLKALVLVINSPGGAPTQTNLIASFIRKKAEAKEVPVYAVVEDVAASGGYWLACAADEIYVDPNSMVGSIGVIFQNMGFYDAMKKIGVEPRVITSVKNKAGLNPFVEHDKEQVELVKGNMMIVHKNFVNWVKERRPSLNDLHNDVFTGRVFVGEEAVERGLANGVASLSDLIELKFPNRDHLKLIEVRPKAAGGLLNLLGHFLQSGCETMDLTSALLYDFHLATFTLPRFT